MVLYTCQRCGYENKIKSHFIKHLNRKKPCDITLLAVDKRVSNKKSYIEKKKDGKIDFFNKYFLDEIFFNFEVNENKFNFNFFTFIFFE